MNSRPETTIVSLAFLSVLLVCIMPVQAQRITITAGADRNRVELYERIFYTVTVESDSRQMPDPIPPDFTGFRLTGSPRASSQFSWVNGQVTNTKTFVYNLEARQEGQHTFEPARVETAGGVIRSLPVTVTVMRPGLPGAQSETPSGSAGVSQRQPHGDLFIETVVDNTRPYTGEAVRVSYHVFTRVNIRDYGIQEEPEYHGFWVETVDIPGQIRLHSRVIDGIEYGEAKLHEVILYPTVTGELIIPPLIMGFQIQDRRRDSFDNFFSSPFQSGFFGTRRENRSTQPLVLQVRPLPEAGKPVDFGGAVGQFRFEASINNREVTVGEPVIVSVTLSGNHGLRTITAPGAPSTDAFRVFDPKADSVVLSAEIPGWKQRTYDYVFVPLRAGELMLPSISFTYFDTETETYQTRATDTFPVSVKPSAGDWLTVSTGNDGREFRRINVDIRYIKTESGLSDYSPPYRQFWFALSFILPLLAVPGVIAADARKRRLEGDTLLVRELRAKSAAAKRFVQARTACRNQDADGAVDALAHAYALYLADRLGLPAGGITLRHVENALVERRVDAQVVNQIKAFWENLETARYSPVKVSLDTVRTLTETGQQLVNRLERVRFKTREPSRDSKTVNQ